MRNSTQASGEACSRAIQFLSASLLASLIAGCGGTGGDANESTSAPVSSGTLVSGTATGVTANGRIGLTDNGGDATTVAADGTFSFPSRLATTQTFNVAVASVAGGEVCTVLRGTGVASSVSAASAIQVLCGPAERRSFHPAAPMRTARSGHALVKLADGTIVAFGGQAASGTTPEVERYDSRSDAWTALPALPANMAASSAIALSGSKVLLAVIVFTGRTTFNVVPMLYDVAAGSLTSTGPFVRIGAVDSWVRLTDGRVVATDGSSAEIYDPASNGWTPTSAFAGTHLGGVLVVMNNGNVLLAGVRTPEILDLTTGRWSTAGSSAHDRLFPLAQLLPNGRVLVVGGTEATGLTGFITDAEIFDPLATRWLPAGSLSTERNGLTITLMPTGKVVAVGGNDTAFDLPTKVVFPTTHRSAEAYDPATNTWSAWADMAVARSRHAAVLTDDGKLLVTGGFVAAPATGTAVQTILQPSSEIAW